MNFSLAAKSILTSSVADSRSCGLHVSSSGCRRSNEDHLLLPSPFGACNSDLEMVVVVIFLVVENCVAWSNTLG